MAHDSTNPEINNPPFNNQIYKVNHVVNEKISTIYVFSGTQKETTQLDLFFSPKEIDEIQKENIHVVFSEQQIHLDDTIGTIKIKLLKEFKERISMEEIYFYCQKIETLHSVAIYQSLTQNKKVEITNLRLEQFLSNLVSNETGEPFVPPPQKESYNYEDILEMKLNDQTYLVNKVVGQKFFLVEKEYPFVCNPFQVTDYDRFFEKHARKSLTTLTNHLLLNTGEIVDNNIYLCLAEDVLNYASSQDLSQETTLKIYYPFLYEKNINEKEELEEQRPRLIESNKKIVNTNTFTAFQTIDMFYDVYKLRNSELSYLAQGIKYVKAILVPEIDMKLPLEVIFKVIHATKNNPLIKYNPSLRQENVYRLYTGSAISIDGRKIPYLKKSSIFKLMKTIAKTKSVAVYIEHKNELNDKDKPHYLICEFEENGYITVTTEFDTVVSDADIDSLFRDALNPIIHDIQDMLLQSGYKLNDFHSLKDKNVEIKQLTYETRVEIKKPFAITQYQGCVSSIFNVETNSATKGIQMRYKRVANFSKVTSQEAFIIEKSSQGLRGSEIIEALLENFPEDLDRKGAEELIRKVANEIQLEKGARKSDIKIKDNPGFKTLAKTEKNGVLTITMENINDIYYLTTIPIYLDTMIRLTQNKNTTNYPAKMIQKLCSGAVKEDIIIPDIVSSSESSILESEESEKEEEEEEEEEEYDKYIKPTKAKGAFDLFFDEDEDEVTSENGDEDESEKLEGGQLSSESSIKSNESSLSSFPSDLSSVQETQIPSPLIPSPAVLSPAVLSPAVSSPAVSSPAVLSPAVLSPAVSSPAVLSPAVSSPSSVQKIDSPLPSKEDQEDQENQNQDQEDQDQEDQDQDQDQEEEDQEDQEEEEEEPEPQPEPKPSKKVEKKAEKEPEINEVKNIDGLKLNKPYYFQTLIEEKDPVLILKEDTREYNAYSRTCSSDTRRQPVILTDSQLKVIEEEHPGFLKEEDVIKYGSNPQNKFNYICPRYWCLKNNTVIDPKDLKEVVGKDGKTELMHPTCGKVIPRGDKAVKPGYYIYEFYGEGDNKRYPGFQTNKHPDGYCLPCCFDKYNTRGRIDAKKECLQDKSHQENQPDDALQKQPKESEEETHQDEYIKGPDKFPLLPGKWGYLPFGIEKILQQVNASCQISKSNTNIKPNHPCLLRHGVEVNKNQSFIACISDILFFAKRLIDEQGKATDKTVKILSIKEMKERIIQSFTMDTFIKYQNGNLVSDFYDSNKKVNETDMASNKYKKTKLFTKLDMQKPEDKFYYMKVVSSFENFIRYLRDDDAIIDHTYLWDIISLPNKYLFRDGVNLVIFKLPNDDITNNVQLLCPTNHYSNQFYEARKPTIILMKEEGYYEPIYSYTVTEKKLTIAKEFKEYDVHLSQQMKTVIKQIIKPFYQTVCKPLESIPNVYKAKRPLLLHELIQKLDSYDYEVEKEVVNFNNKVIGVLAKDPGGKEGFVPCYPSSISENMKEGLDYVFMTDLSLWKTYEETFSFLKKLNKRSGKRRETPDLPCNPAFKIMEDELVVGILTETNQFVQISQPISELQIMADQNLPSIRNANYIVNHNARPMVPIDVPTTTQDDVDKERVDYIKRIKLETSFYNVFRNSIRILLNDYEHLKIRDKIVDETKKQFLIYSEKLANVMKWLRELVKDKIQFIGDDNYYKLINEVTTCIVKNKDKCADSPNLCVVTENGNCNLILPIKNLITGKPNETIYYGKMADELIRYSRIRSFIFQPQSYLSFTNINYNLRDDEIILIQSLLTQEYFDSLIPASVNAYAKYISYDEAEPQVTQLYDNVIRPFSESQDKPTSTSCAKTIKKNITSTLWKKCFPENYKEIEYGNTNVCTFSFIIDLVERKTQNKLSINKVKNDLYEAYRPYLDRFSQQMVDILILEGKKTMGDQVKSGALSFSNFIFSENYFLTTLDFWVLVQKYQLPVIFLSQKPMLQTNNSENILVGYGDETNDFAFVILPAFRPENIPKYKVVINNSNETFVSLTEIKEECNETIHGAFLNKMSIESYLDTFQKPKKTTEPKKVRLLKIVGQPEERQEEQEQEQAKPLEKKVGRPKKILKIVNNEPEPLNKEPNANEVVPIIPPNEEKSKRKTKKKVLRLRGEVVQKTKKNRETNG